MHRPLYKEAANARLAQAGNCGLWYDKFCDQWKPDYQGLLDPPANKNDENQGKSRWVHDMASKNVGDADLLDEAAKRQIRLVVSCGGQLQSLRTEGPFVTGLGRSHPVENGFAWHQVYGTPYLPGSSIKGLVRSWASQWLKIDENDLDRVFGPRRKEGDDDVATGSVVFTDALPPQPVQLKAEVMTPHYSEWYQTGRPPGDWLSPNPIPFLAVETGQVFHFAVLPRIAENTGHVTDCRTAAQWLREALEAIGAGAKTAAGYGRFRFEAAEQENLERRIEGLLYPWQAQVRRIESLENWGQLKDTVLENEEVSDWQAEPEIAKAVKAKAEEIRDAKPEKWTADRDETVAEWLKMGGINWNPLQEAAQDVPEDLSPQAQEAVEKIRSLNDWGQWVAQGLSFSDLPHEALVALQEKFESWGIPKHKNPEKKKAYKELKKHLRKG